MSGRPFLTCLALDGCWDPSRPTAVGHAAGLADQAGVDMLMMGGPGSRLDPLVVAGWLAPRIGRSALVTVLPALHAMPFHVARALSALDFLTAGRSGWAPTTADHAAQAQLYGRHAEVGPEEVCAKAVDFILATCALWDSWDGDALIIDKAAGVYLDSDKVRRVHYRGPYFKVMGPLNAARPPQGYPPLVLSDADPLWWQTADRADVLIIEEPDADGLAARRGEIAGAGGHARLLARVRMEDGRSAPLVVGELQVWLGAGLVDGVAAAPQSLAGLEAFTGGFLSELRRRGLAAPAAPQATLRQRLGLAVVPAPAFVGA